MGTDGACGLLFSAAKRSGTFPPNMPAGLGARVSRLLLCEDIKRTEAKSDDNEGVDVFMCLGLQRSGGADVCSPPQ